jgi:hypothetical protein
VAIDCDLVTPGVQASCTYGGSDVTVAVVLTNSGPEEISVGHLAFEVVANELIFDPKPGVSCCQDGNPDFYGPTFENTGNWNCNLLPPEPDIDPHPENAVSRMECFETGGIGGVTVSAGESVILARVHYSVGEQDGTGDFTIQNMVLAKSDGLLLAACNPPLEVATPCYGAQITYQAGDCPGGVTTCAAGFWSGGLDATHVLGECSLSLSQTVATVASVIGLASCTVAGGGAVSGTFNQTSRFLNIAIAFSQPQYNVGLTGTLSGDEDTITGNWTCTCGSGAVSLSRASTRTSEFIATSGGILATASGDNLTVPAGALSADTVLTSIIQPVPAPPPPGLASISRAYDFGPDGTTFATPITAVFQYTDDDLAGGLIDPSTLRVYVYDSTNGEWDLLGGVVDTVARTITVEISHFSDFAIFGEVPASLDADGDAVVDAVDNCVGTSNPSQSNYDRNFIELGPTKAFDDLTRPNSDGLGDACDEDDDNDGLTDVDELSGAACGGIITDPLKEDTDGDRVLDGAECALGTDPTNPASFPSAAACGATTDADGDGVAAFREYCYYNTDPNNANTDGDACDDGKEIASINADLAVNVIDLSQIAGAFGPASGPLYLVQFDVNKDGAINVLDLSFVAGRFGVC